MEPTAGMAGDSAALAALLAAQSSAVAQLSSGQRRAPNPNRAREEQRRELLQLREQAPRLEQALARLKWRVRRRRRQLAAGGGAWRELAASRRELREQAQRENAQLRAVVQRQIEIGRAMQRMLQAQLRWESARDSGVPCLAERTETAIFERLLAGVARSFSEVDAIFVAYGTDDALPSEADEEVAPMEIMARRVDGVNARGSSQRQAVSWRYFARPIEYMPWRVSVQPEQPDSEPRKEPTIIESCGVKLYASESFDSEHVYQFLKKTKENERIEIEWGSSPDTSLATLFGGHLSHPEVEFNASRRCPHSDNSFQQHLAASTSDLDAMLQPDSPWGQLTSHSVGEHDFHGTCAESLEVTARKVMPFDVQATGEATWQYLAHVLERVDFRFYYKKDNQNLNVSDSTVVEGFRFELAPHGRRRVCARVHQVLRKHEHTEGRVVMVWRATTDVFEFGGKAVRGACYHEKGYLEVRQATAGSMDGALVQTCYLITPRWEASCMLDAQDRSEVTSTVLSSTTANIITSYQMIESALLDEAVRSLQMWE